MEEDLFFHSNEQFYQEFFENTSEGIYIINVLAGYRFKVITHNPAHEKATGYKAEDVRGKYLEEFLPKITAEKLIGRLKKCLESDTTISCDEEVEFPIGKCYFHTTLIPIRDKQGKINRIIGIDRNITELKKTELVLRESEEKYRSIIELSPDAIYIQCEGQYVFMNKAGLKLFGATSEDQMIGRNIIDMVHPDYKDIVRERIQHVKDFKAQVPLLEEKYLRIDGSVFDVEVVASYIKYNNKHGALVLVRDISERKKAEQAIKASEARFRAVLENSQDIIYQWNIQTNKFDYISPAVSRLVGYSSEELVVMPYKTIISFIHPDDVIKIKDLVSQSRSKTIDNFNIEYRCHCKNGQYRWQNNLSSVVMDEQGHLLYYVGSIRDITEQKGVMDHLSQAKEKAEESDRLKSAFLANMSHEIRTPLNAIMGFADLLDNSDLSDDKRQKYTQVIQQRGNDLLNLINDILVMSKIEAGQMDIVESRTDLSVLFEEIHQFFNDQNKFIQKKPIEFKYSCKLDQNQRFVLADTTRIKQILINLLTNSFKFTNSGTIEFSCELKSNNLLFYVSDTGIGIPEDKLDIIFERFSQVSDSYLTRQHGGTGLGLSICKGLLELMHGAIWLNSQPNIGTTFYFTIPYKPDLSIPKIPEKSINNVYDWHNKTILIVEDDKFNAEYLVECLIKTKVNCKLAPNGATTLNILHSLQDIDLILMDIQLPDINGYNLTKQIKLQNPNIIIIAQTAYASENEKNKCLETGCDNYIAKPINREMLLQMIQKHFVVPVRKASKKVNKHISHKSM